MLFDFRHRWYVATAACAFIIAVVVSLFVAQEERIEQLEKESLNLRKRNHVLPKDKQSDKSEFGKG